LKTAQRVLSVVLTPVFYQISSAYKTSKVISVLGSLEWIFSYTSLCCSLGLDDLQKHLHPLEFSLSLMSVQFMRAEEMNTVCSARSMPWPFVYH